MLYNSRKWRKNIKVIINSNTFRNFFVAPLPHKVIPTDFYDSVLWVPEVFPRYILRAFLRAWENLWLTALRFHIGSNHAAMFVHVFIYVTT